MITPTGHTRVSALDFHTAKTTRLSLRLGTLGQKGFSIQKSGKIETLAHGALLGQVLENAQKYPMAEISGGLVSRF